MPEEKITPLQATNIVAGYLLGTSIVINTTAKTGTDAWLSLLVSFAGGLLLVGLTSGIAMLHPGKSLTEILIVCFGGTTGHILGFCYLLYATWLSGAVILTFSSYNMTMNLPETPSLYISVCYVLVIAFAVKLGLEVIGRVSEVLLIVILITTVFTFFSFLESFHPDAFLPLFKNGPLKPVIVGLLGSPLPYGEIFLALNLLPNLDEPKKAARSLINAAWITGGVILLFMLRNMCVLGADVTSRDVYPSEKVFRLIPYLNILPFLDINVIISGIIKVSVSLYSQVKIFGDLFGLKNFKIFVLPFAVLDVFMSLFIDNNLLSQLYVAANVVPFLYLPGLVLMPLLVLTISLFKKEKPRPGTPETE